jgi:hypothetical protein
MKIILVGMAVYLFICAGSDIETGIDLNAVSFFVFFVGAILLWRIEQIKTN